MRAAPVLAAMLLAAGPLAAQPAGGIEAPPPGGIVARDRPYAVGLGLGRLDWNSEAPYDDVSLASLMIERTLLRWARGRAAIAAGSTTLEADEPVDTWVISLDLQLLLVADLGPFRAAGVEPYVLGGFGSLVTNPSGEGGVSLPTRAQSQVVWGGGVLARLGHRWEARGEGIRARLRLADPLVAENGETTTIHTNRWEGRIHWLF